MRGRQTPAITHAQVLEKGGKKAIAAAVRKNAEDPNKNRRGKAKTSNTTRK